MSTLVIGFANVFYTLWSVSETEHFSMVGNKYIKTGTTYLFTYHKSISKSLDKVKKLYPDVKIDDTLRGMNRSFERTVTIKSELPENVFPYGNMMGSLIIECEDVWQLKRLFDNKDHFQHTPKRRALARKRLIELGELVKVNPEEWNITDKYIEKSHYKFLVTKKSKQEASGYFFNNGDKVELTLRRVHLTSFDSTFGRVYIATYQDNEDRLFYYKGGSVPEIENDFKTIRATIKHNEYRDLKQTLIQRVKIVNN